MYSFIITLVIKINCFIFQHGEIRFHMQDKNQVVKFTRWLNNSCPFLWVIELHIHVYTYTIVNNLNVYKDSLLKKTHNACITP